MANGKNFTNNEWFFQFIFPVDQMFRALQLEALAQMLTVAITTFPAKRE